MNKLSGLDLIDYAVEEDVDFLAFVVSPWHMLGVQAVLAELLQEYESLHGIIALCKNGNGNYTINPELYKHMMNVEFVYYDSSVGKDSRVLNTVNINVQNSFCSEERRFFIIPHRVDILLCSYYTKRQKGKRVVCYVIDEGLGTYIGVKRNNTNKNGQYRVSIKEKIVDFIVKRYSNMLIRTQKYNNFSILELKNKDEWVENERAIKYYRRALENKAVRKLEDNKMYYNAVLINTQPFMGAGIPPNNVDIDILLYLCKLCKRNNINVVIKPHPGQRDLDRYERLTEYVYFDLRKELTQEEILSSIEIKPRAVVAFSSTTLLTCKLFYKIPAFSLASILLKENINMFHKERLNAFIEAFKNQIFIYESVDTIFENIMKL